MILSDLAQTFQTSSHVSQLLQQREESDTKIRAEMFKAITDRLFSEKEGRLPPEQKAVFSELLALNFHEHIEASSRKSVRRISWDTFSRRSAIAIAGWWNRM